MTDIPEDYKYTESHEWVVPSEDHTVRMGITDHAQSQLGDVVFVELPEVGKTVAQGESFGVIESVKAASDLYAPIAGEIIEVNEQLAEQPQLVNESTYEEGWIIKIKPNDMNDVSNLLTAEQYQAAINETIKE